MAKVGKPSKARSQAEGAWQQEAMPADSVSQDQRQRMIAEAAYFRAAQRGFQGGDPVADWLAAEREVNRVLPSAVQRKA